MIAPRKKHIEKMKLSDRFAQPFEQSSTRDMVHMFNARNQKKTKPKKKR